ncbi:MAG: DUF1947 domain-containing protein [Acidilobaceae archaeon]|nr:DUF1947 domain-containing protein [Acidilobaceae archaeon]MCX8165442.1 DUF1947 domain-containing protein [Acidilobaceae archaeon]MDW7973869.1 DUF1947 domain-containing protein [Sulfolobales archaeon]
MSKLSRRHHLSKRDVRALREELTASFPALQLQLEEAEQAKLGEREVYIINGILAFFREGSRLVPSLRLLLKLGFSWLPAVGVDRGATKAVIRGADLMAPGIKAVEGSFERGSFVVIFDLESRAPIAVGEALISAPELAGMQKGKALRVVHRVGDEIWEASQVV